MGRLLNLSKPSALVLYLAPRVEMDVNRHAVKLVLKTSHGQQHLCLYTHVEMELANPKSSSCFVAVPEVGITHLTTAVSRE